MPAVMRGRAGRRAVMSAVPAAMMPTVGMIAVEGVAAYGSDASAEDGTGQRVAVESGGESGTGHGTHGRGGKHSVFARAAGREAEAEEGDEEKGECAAHGFLLGGEGRVPSQPPRSAAFYRDAVRFRFFSAPGEAHPESAERAGTLEYGYTEAGAPCHVIKRFTLFLSLGVLQGLLQKHCVSSCVLEPC